jgi:hypothetical protein
MQNSRGRASRTPRFDARKDTFSPEQIERQRREYEQDMRRMLWAVGPIVILFFLIWLVHQ